MEKSSSSKPVAAVSTQAADHHVDAEVEPFGSETASSVFDDSIIGIQAFQMEALESAVTRSAAYDVPIELMNVDPFANINDCSPEHVERLANILEIRGAQPRPDRAAPEGALCGRGPRSGRDAPGLGHVRRRTPCRGLAA